MEEIKKKYGLAKVFQAIMCVWDILALDERIQVNGFVLLHDGGLSDSDTALAYNMTNMRKCFHIFQVSYEIEQFYSVCEQADQDIPYRYRIYPKYSDILTIVDLRYLDVKGTL